MHDPSTVAFDIKYPWRTRPSEHWPKGYRNTFITIWHEDPLDFEGKCGCRDDDSCGWFTPPMLVKERDDWRKRADYEYTCVFNKQDATAKGKSYAYVCFHPETTYDAIYWIWRSIRHEHLKGKWWYRTLWRYSSRPSARELEAIQNLASNPVDNLQFTFRGVKDAETFWPFYLCILKAYRRNARPWYQHPRWHIWHWRIQVHPWRKLRRRLFDRCAECGGHFGWNESPIGTWGGDRIWHSGCDRARAASGPGDAAGLTRDASGGE